MSSINQQIADLFSGKLPVSPPSSGTGQEKRSPAPKFSYLFFSDVRKDVADREKYFFTRELVEFADQSRFEAVYFPERHFYEFGSIYANNAIMAAYLASITRNIRLRTAAVTNTLHHPVEIVENWAMVDILSGGRVDIGFGSGWNKADFVLSPDTYENRETLRNERIPIIQKLWRGETVNFPGPGGELFPVTVYPRPLQKELTVWYVTTSEKGFAHAGKHGYQIFTMLYGFNLNELRKRIQVYRQARQSAGLDPNAGIVSLMMHTFVHPDMEWVKRAVSSPFKAYIRSSLLSHMKAAGKTPGDKEIAEMVDYSYTKYFQTAGIFGPLADCQKQIDHAVSVGVNEIAFLQDFGVDYQAVKDSLPYLKQLVDQNLDKGINNEQ